MPVARIAPTRPMRMPVTAAPPPTRGPRGLRRARASALPRGGDRRGGAREEAGTRRASPDQGAEALERLALFVYLLAARPPFGATFLAPAPGPALVAARCAPHAAG